MKLTNIQWISFLLTFLLKYGASQCYTGTDCTGDVVSASDLQSCCVDTDAGLSFNDGGSCSICIVHGFERAVYNIDEDSRLDTEFRLNVKGHTTLPLLLNGTITVTASGTSDESDFQNLLPIRIFGYVTFRIFVSSDDIALEYDDRILLQYSSDEPGFISGVEGLGQFVRETGTIYIVDNDLLEINFEEADLTVTEGSSILSTPIKLQFKQIQSSFTITLSPVSIDEAESMGLGTFIASDAIASTFRATTGADFTENTLTITIPPNQRYYCIGSFFNVTADDIDENEQSFAVVAEIGQDVPDGVSCFQIADGQEGCTTERYGATRIRINDTDLMIIGFTQRQQNIGEESGPVGVDQFPIIIHLDTAITSERIHDMTIRLQETISNASVNDYYSPNTDAVFGSRFSSGEPLTHNIRLQSLQDTLDPLQVFIIDDSAEEGNECFTIRINPDDVPGRRELFSCNEDGTNAGGYFCSHTVCILDDDGPYFLVAFQETLYTVNEEVGSVQICVSLKRTPYDSFNESINVFTIDYSNSEHIPTGTILATPDSPDFLGHYSMKDGTDYAQQTISFNEIDDLNLTESRRVVCYNQTIYNDIRLESDEYSGLSLGVVHIPTVLSRAQPIFDQASILIQDDDTAIVGLEQTLYAVIEETGPMDICVVVLRPNIICPINFTFDVRVNIIDGTAVFGLDYSTHISPIVISFDKCATRACFQVQIFHDEFDEQVEYFNFTLDSTSEPLDIIILQRSVGQTKITDYTPPPSGVGVHQRGEGRLEVTWTPSGGSTVTGYIIYYQLTGGEEMSVIVNGRTTVSTNITGLSAGTYSVSMVATSTSLPSSRTSPLTVDIVVNSPTDVRVVQDSTTSITVTWTPPSPLGDITGYRISYTGGGGDSSGREDISGGSTNTYTLTGLQNGLTYTISIASTSQTSASDNVTVEVTLIPAPGEVSVEVRSITATSISLSWSVASGSVSSWEVVWRETDRGTESLSGSLPGTSYTIDQLDSTTIYTVRVTATNVAGTTTSNTLFISTGGMLESTCPQVDESCKTCSETTAIIGGIVVAIVFIIATTITVIVIVILVLRHLRHNTTTSTATKTRQVKLTNVPDTTSQSLELSKFPEPTYVDPDQVQTSSNEAYNIVRGTRGTRVEGEYETPQNMYLPPPPTSSSLS